MSDDLQALIRRIPDCIDGPGAADFTASVAKQVRDQAPGLDTAGNWFDLGEGTKVYSTERIIAAANELDLYGDGLRYKSGTFCRGSDERNRIITLLGNVYGLVGARVGVNATLAEARKQLAEDLLNNAKNVGKGIFDYGKWIVVGVVALAIIFILVRFK